MPPDAPQLTEDQQALLAAREDLAAYGRLVHTDDAGRPLVPAQHHWWWIERLEDVERGAIKRLLVIAPPGFAKSTWLSLTFVPWYLMRHPSHKLLLITSNDPQARKFATAIQHTLEVSPENAAIFPEAACRPDKSRGWSHEGMYLKGTPAGSNKDPAFQAIGANGSIMGNRANGILLDDPLTQKDSNSDIVLADFKAEHDQTVKTRLIPDIGWEIGIMTSWNERDVPHWLAQKPGWHVVHMPALGDDAIKPISKTARFYSLPKGQSLWPERFSAEYLLSEKADMTTALFNAVYQGDPTAMGGLVFKDRSWFRPLPADFDRRDGEGRTPRERLFTILAWDLNFSLNEAANYTVGLTVGVDDFKNLYVLGERRGHYSETTDVQDVNGLPAVMIDEIERRQPDVVVVSDAAFRQTICKQIVDIVRQHVWADVRPPEMAQADKETMARIPAGKAEGGQLFVDMEAPWADDLVQECTAFPKGVYDDQVDALSLAAAWAAKRRIYTEDELEEMATPQPYSFRR